MGELSMREQNPSDQTQETLILYHSQLCGFCWMVRDAIDKLDIDVELRDVMRSREHREELIEARGRGTVPVLRRVQQDGTESWMPESADIIQYLKDAYG